MASKQVFSEQAEQLTTVVHALLQNDETRAAFAKEPLATLKHYGIDFKDAAVAKKVEAELAVFAGRLADIDFCPPLVRAITPRTWLSIYPKTWTGPIVSITNTTWVAKGDLDDVIRIDQPRVDAFVTRINLETKISVLEARIAELEAKR